MKKLLVMLLTLALAVALALPMAIPAMANPEPGLIGLWRFNGDANDSSGNGLNGTVHGAIYGPSPMGQALTFDGNDYVEVADNSLLEPASITVEAWVKRSGSPGNMRFIVAKQWPGATYTPSYGFLTGGAGGLGGIQFYVGGSTYYSASPEAPPSRVWDGNWHHVAGTYQGPYNNVRLYLDGAEVGTGTYSNLNIGYSGTGNLYIGAHDSGGGWPFKGEVDEVRIWNTVLTASQIGDTTAPSAPSLVSPASGAYVNTTVALDWSDVTDPTGVKYQVQVDNNADFNSPEYSSLWIASSTATTAALPQGAYNWRVRARDGALNIGDWSTVWTFTVDTTPPTVTINQAAGQADPTNTSPINFTVIFSEPVTDFATGNVTLSGTAGATTAEVTGGGDKYNVAVSGMTSGGTVIASVDAGKAHDAAGNANTVSTSTDNTVTYLDVIKAVVDIDPNTLNLKSQSDKNAFTAYIELPSGYSVANINVSTVKLKVNGTEIAAQLTPTSVGDYDKDGVADRMVKFGRQAVINALAGTTGDITLIVSGQLTTGQQFSGSDTIKVINPGK